MPATARPPSPASRPPSRALPTPRIPLVPYAPPVLLPRLPHASRAPSVPLPCPTLACLRQADKYHS